MLFFKTYHMIDNKQFDVIIVGGSYSGLAAGMSLGRALKNVLIIDSGIPCNRQTPHSHNFLTQDGKTPVEIAVYARQQVLLYDTVEFFNGLAIGGAKTGSGFEIYVASGQTFHAGKLIFATGISDTMPMIDGLAACWGISVLHCPFCHGYEVRNSKTGVMGNGQSAYELVMLISNWTRDLTLFTNGKSLLTAVQKNKLRSRHIEIKETQVERLQHVDGQLEHIVFRDGNQFSVRTLYAHVPFVQHCSIPESLGCELTQEGYIRIDAFQETTVPGIFSCGDNVTRTRTVANAVAMGTSTGMVVSRKIIFEEF
jgi:thioredoxin reductase